MTRALLDDGFYTNLAMFPAVPMKHAGVRMTLTVHHTLDDVRALVGALAEHVPAALERGGEAAKRRHAKVTGDRRPALTLEHHTTADALDAREWDSLLGERGTFTVDGLQFLERAFAGGERPEDEWAFHYYLVRDRAGTPCWPRSSPPRCGRTTCSPPPRSPSWSRSAAPRTRTT